jgi:hypothetical protein
MEVYTLDSNLRRNEIVESFESMIWTERYGAWGDFQLDIDPALAERDLFTQGTPIAINKSERIMTVDTAQIAHNADGKKVLTVKGKSLEAILEQRPNQYEFYAGAPVTEQAWGPVTPGNTPGNIIRALLDNFTRTNTLIPADNLPFLSAGTINSTSGAIAEFAEAVSLRGSMDTLYNTVKNIADVYRLGFRLVWREGGSVLGGSNPSKLYWEVYTGWNRTTDQLVNDPVIFAESLDNLTDTVELTTTAGWKNMAYVTHPLMTRIVYATGIDPAIAGFDRKVLIVDASDISGLTGTPLSTAMDQRGREELSKNDIAIGFDGKISQNSSYIYGTHYKLGDLVEQRSSTGIITNMTVTEQIFVSDTTGEKSYPTLSYLSTTTPGTWNSIAAGKVWYDYTSEVWATV